MEGLLWQILNRNTGGRFFCVVTNLHEEGGLDGEDFLFNG